jgi:Spy/CpxP family protein refolding chaperone
MKPFSGSLHVRKSRKTWPLLLSAAFFLVSPISLSAFPAFAQASLPDAQPANFPAPPPEVGEPMEEVPGGSGPIGLADGEQPFEPINFAMAPPGGGCPVFGSLKGDAALTDEQWEKMHSLKNEFLDKLGPKMVESMSLERHLKDVLTSGDIDLKKANELKGKLASVKTELANLKIDNQIKAMAILTPEQRKAIRLSDSKGRGFGAFGKGRSCHSMGRRGVR